MTALAVSADGLSKDYVIGLPGRRVVTLGETVQAVAAAPWRRLRRQAAARPRRTVATVLDDVSFDIAQGEAVGFVGHNGAGKSTLLKVLSRITAPTRGRGEVHGRVGALLEVATGFHPELTGRENVFLNGAVLGMQRTETARRFDEIVAFADVEKFLDTPVKRYSSGMTVRLAFAVAAHLEPDVLIVDEVLAVGDAGFQRRCVRRMAEVANEGRTVLFVSHNMSVLQSLCRRGIVLEHGRVVEDAPVATAVGAYLRGLEELQQVDLVERTDRRGVGGVRLIGLEVQAPESAVPTSGAPLRLVLHLDQVLPSLTCDVRLVDELGIVLTTLSSAFPGDGDTASTAPCFSVDMPELLLAPGRYRLDVSLSSGRVVLDEVQSAASFEVAPGALRGRAVSLEEPGRLLLPHSWTLPG